MSGDGWRWIRIFRSSFDRLRTNGKALTCLTNEQGFNCRIANLLLLQCLNELIRIIKPIDGEMIVKGYSILKEFYQENQWRYAPNTDSFEFYDDYQKIEMH